jgi:hypothetical protein
MILISTGAIFGGLGTLLALHPLGWPLAIAGAPFGGSLAALALSVAVALRRGRHHRAAAAVSRI